MAAFFQDLSTSDMLVLGLIVVVLILAILVVLLDRKVKRLLRGKNAQSLEQVILDLGRGITYLDKRQQASESHLANLETRLKGSVRGVGTIRFSSFERSGDGQSFAIALLSEEGDGVILSTLSMRERTSVFAKPIKRFVSEQTLMEEEKAALEHARQNI